MDQHCNGVERSYCGSEHRQELCETGEPRGRSLNHLVGEWIDPLVAWYLVKASWMSPWRSTLMLNLSPKKGLGESRAI